MSPFFIELIELVFDNKYFLFNDRSLISKQFEYYKMFGILKINFLSCRTGLITFK